MKAILMAELLAIASTIILPITSEAKEWSTVEVVFGVESSSKGIFKDRIPYDTQFLIKGTVPENAKRIDLVVTQGAQAYPVFSSALTAGGVPVVAKGVKPIATATYDFSYGEKTEFLLKVGPLKPNTDYCFSFCLVASDNSGSPKLPKGRVFEVEEKTDVELTDYFRQDFGYAIADKDNSFLFTNVNIHFAPTNPKTSLKDLGKFGGISGFFKRFSIFAGVGVNNIKNDSNRKALILDGYGTLGFGFRLPVLSHPMSLSRPLEKVSVKAGWMIYKTTDKVTTSTDTLQVMTTKQLPEGTFVSETTVTKTGNSEEDKLARDFFVGVTLDLSLLEIIGKMGSIFK